MSATTAIVTGKSGRTGTPRPRGGMTRRRPVDWLLLALVVAGGILVLVPFYLVLVNSFKSPVDYATSGPLALPHELDFTGIAEQSARDHFEAEFREAASAILQRNARPR